MSGPETMAELLADLPPAGDRPAAKPERRGVTVRTIGAELHRALEIRRLLQAEGETDPRLLADMIEGSTELAEACCVVLEEIGEDELLIAGIDAMIAQLEVRKGRLERSVETRRLVILQAMDRAGLDTIKSPAGTISRQPVPPKLVIADEALVPAKYFRRPDPVVDRKAIKAALDAGEAIPGASLGNGGITLSIRRK